MSDGKAQAAVDVEGLAVDYGRLRAVQGVTLSVYPGESVGIVGANGAGKSSVLRCIGGLVSAAEGSIRIEGRELRRPRPWSVPGVGVRLVPESRELFKDLSVAENLRAGTYLLRRGERAEQVEQVLGVFPRLRQLLRSRAGALSGGEQQMLAIGRALAGRPRTLLLDEPALGLAPAAIGPLAEALLALKEMGLAILVAEQSLAIPRRLCDRVMVCQLGKIVASGTPDEVLTPEIVSAAFAVGRHSGVEAGRGDDRTANRESDQARTVPGREASAE
jgi:branched-chain amino acid transport system ATP-binding protein